MKRLKDFMFPAIVVAGIAIFALSGRNAEAGSDYEFAGKPEIIVATFSSAWCSSCKILIPRLAKVIPDFADKPVKFVEFDFTFGQRKEIYAQAEAEGLGDLYPRYKGATGFALLVDKETGEILDMLTINHSKQAMRAAISQAVALASRDSEEVALAN